MLECAMALCLLVSSKLVASVVIMLIIKIRWLNGFGYGLLPTKSKP